MFFTELTLVCGNCAPMVKSMHVCHYERKKRFETYVSNPVFFLKSARFKNVPIPRAQAGYVMNLLLDPLDLSDNPADSSSPFISQSPHKLDSIISFRYNDIYKGGIWVKYCRFCGKPLQEMSTFCPHCMRKQQDESDRAGEHANFTTYILYAAFSADTDGHRYSRRVGSVRLEPIGCE